MVGCQPVSENSNFFHSWYSVKSQTLTYSFPLLNDQTTSPQFLNKMDWGSCVNAGWRSSLSFFNPRKFLLFTWISLWNWTVTVFRMEVVWQNVTPLHSFKLFTENRSVSARSWLDFSALFSENLLANSQLLRGTIVVVSPLSDPRSSSTEQSFKPLSPNTTS